MNTVVTANVFLCLTDPSVILLSNLVSCTYSEIPLTRLPSAHGNSVCFKGVVLMVLGQIKVQYALNYLSTLTPL